MVASERSPASLFKACEQLVELDPPAQTPRRLALDLYPPDESFVAKVKEYVRST